MLFLSKGEQPLDTTHRDGSPACAKRVAIATCARSAREGRPRCTLRMHPTEWGGPRRPCSLVRYSALRASTIPTTKPF